MITHKNISNKIIVAQLFLFCSINCSFAKVNLNKTALLIIDVQNDFCAGGSLELPHADEVIPAINNIRSNLDFGLVIFTQDWHPPNHISFYERFENKTLYPTAQLRQELKFDLHDGRGQRSQILWPTHCVQNSTGAAIRIGLKQESTDRFVHKGINPDIDSYSAFVDNLGVEETDLDQILKENGIEELLITGLAFEFCVGNTAKDAIKKGYKVTIVDDATGLFDPARYHESVLDLQNAGIIVKGTKELFREHLRESGVNTSSSCKSCSCGNCICTAPKISHNELNETAADDIMLSNCKCPDCQCNCS